jgi:hypothetical protein
MSHRNFLNARVHICAALLDVGATGIEVPPDLDVQHGQYKRPGDHPRANHPLQISVKAPHNVPCEF